MHPRIYRPPLSIVLMRPLAGQSQGTVELNHQSEASFTLLMHWASSSGRCCLQFKLYSRQQPPTACSCLPPSDKRTLSSQSSDTSMPTFRCLAILVSYTVFIQRADCSGSLVSAVPRPLSASPMCSMVLVQLILCTGSLKCFKSYTMLPN